MRATLLFLVGMLWGSGAAAQQPASILWLALDFSPCHIHDGSGKGYCDEVGEQVFSQLRNYRFVRDISSISRHRAMFENGQHFCAVDLFRSTQREQFLDYSVPVYPVLPIGLVVAENHVNTLPLNASGAVQLQTLKRRLQKDDMIVGVNKGRVYGSTVDSYLSTLPDDSVYQSTSDESLVTMLAGGRIDFMFLSAPELPFLSGNREQSLAFVPVQGQSLIDTYVTCTKSEDYPGLMPLINQAIENLEPHTLVSLYRKWLPDEAQQHYDRLLRQRSQHEKH